MLMHCAGGATLPASRVRQYLSLLILIQSRHHSGTFAEICMQDSPFCYILDSQSIKWAVICRHNFWNNTHSFSLWSHEKMPWWLWKSTLSETSILEIQISTMCCELSLSIRSYATTQDTQQVSTVRNRRAQEHSQESSGYTLSGRWQAGKRKTEQLLKLPEK